MGKLYNLKNMIFNAELAFLFAVFLFSLLSIFLTAWVVWRVEKKLDISYKFFLLAIVVFSVGILFEILQFYNVIAAWQWDKIFKGLFVVFFTVAVFEMRDLIKSLQQQEIVKDYLQEQELQEQKTIDQQPKIIQPVVKSKPKKVAKKVVAKKIVKK